MEPVNWRGIIEQLDAETASLRRERGRARALKEKVERALSSAESQSPDADIISRLDLLLIVLTQAAKENVCTNTRCPHYDKKCKMR
jgi:hypothetical protein